MNRLDPSKIGIIILLGWVVIIYGGLTFLIVKKKDLTLISGFSNRPKEEQEQLVKSGFIEALSKLLIITFILFVTMYVLWIFSVPYSLEVGFSLFILVLLVGTVWIQRYEVPHKRKKMYWITGIISVMIVVPIVVLTYVGLSENEVTVSDDTLIVSGMYGIEWKLSDIESVELFDELPHVKVRTNGFAAGEHLKGRFLLEEPYGGGLLFVRTKTGPPYLYVATGDDYLIVNRSDAEETKLIYEALRTYAK